MENLIVCSLENPGIAVDLIPAQGGRIASLRSRGSGLEFLTQSTRTGPSPHARLDALFQQGPCAGIEECLPTVGRCEAEGGAVPDHGDFWQLPWQVMAQSSDSLQVSADGFSRTLRFIKTLTLDGNSLHVQYRVENSGRAPQSFLYACHPLFAVSPGDRILLPPEVRDLTLQYSRHSRVGQPGAIIAWPVTSSGTRLDLAGSPDAGTAEMFYTSRLDKGLCGILRQATGQILEVSFDTAALPFLGLWICYGGWPEPGDGPRQYAVALEPTTAPCNTLAQAQQMGFAITLDAGEFAEWRIQLEVIASARHSRLFSGTER